MTVSRAQVTRDALGLGAAVGVSAVPFGALSVTAGLSPAQTQALSLLMFTGGSQFAFVGVLAGGGAVASALAVAWVLGARNTLYTVRMRQLVGLRGWRGAVQTQLVIDETVAMAGVHEPDRALSRHAFLATGAALYVAWNIGTAVGSLGAGVVGDPQVLGLDAAFPAAFLALLGPRLRERSTAAVAVLGAVVAVALTPPAPAGVPVLAAAIVVAPFVVGRRAG